MARPRPYYPRSPRNVRYRGLRPAARWAITLLIVLALAASTTYFDDWFPSSSSDSSPARPGTARAQLDTLAVKGRAPQTGYDRTGGFGEAWIDVDGNGCDTRNDILVRDLEDIVIDDRCRVLSGTITDPYTNAAITFVRGETTSAMVQIDHIVALSNAWQTGAQQITQAQRVELANDPTNLLAVDGSANAQKGDADTATWLPRAKSFRCEYVARQIAVKAEYSLWVTTAEKAAMETVLSSCPDQGIPSD